jgi:threonine/homoserine/homoserine lactone efflux protein
LTIEKNHNKGNPMKLYPLFLLMAAVTVFSPGPGVVMTLTNSLRHGLRGAFGGILGVSFGALVVAAISATSLGVILATSAVAFTTLKLMGAAYLVYLCIKLWRAPAILNGIQAGLSCTPQISFADSSYAQSAMLGCIRPGSIPGPDKGDRHGFPIERMYIFQNYRMLDFKKKQSIE